MVDDSDDSDSDDNEVVIANSRRRPSTTTRSGRRVRAPNRMNLNTINGKKLKCDQGQQFTRAEQETV
jgi:hypothetical protein